MIQPVTCCIIAAFKHSWELCNHHDSHLHSSNKFVNMTVKMWIFDVQANNRSVTACLTNNCCDIYYCLVVCPFLHVSTFTGHLLKWSHISHILEFNDLKLGLPIPNPHWLHFYRAATKRATKHILFAATFWLCFKLKAINSLSGCMQDSLKEKLELQKSTLTQDRMIQTYTEYLKWILRETCPLLKQSQLAAAVVVTF